MVAIANDYDKYLRLLMLTHHGGLNACRVIMHDSRYNGLPKDEGALYAELHKKLRKKGLFTDQKAILFPKDKKTNVMLFDISLITKVIFSCLKIPKDIKTWLNELKNCRNELSHCGQDPKMSDAEFQVKWNTLINLLSNLGFDVSTVADLETCSLDATVKYQVSFCQSKLDLLGDSVDKNSNQIHKLQLSIQFANDAISKNGESVNDIVDFVKKSIKVLEEKTDDFEVKMEHIFNELISNCSSFSELYACLGERVKYLEQEVEDNKEDIQKLKEKSNQDWFVGYACSGQSKCVECEKLIERGSIRIGNEIGQYASRGKFPTKKWYHLGCFKKKTMFCSISGKENLTIIEDLEILYKKTEGCNMPNDEKIYWTKELAKNEAEKEKKEARKKAYLDEGISVIINKSLKEKLQQKTVPELKELLKGQSRLGKLRKEQLIDKVLEIGIGTEDIRGIAKDALKKDYKLQDLKYILDKYNIEWKGKSKKDTLLNQILDAEGLKDGAIASNGEFSQNLACIGRSVEYLKTEMKDFKEEKPKLKEKSKQEWSVEYARSGKSKCNGCRNMIEHKSLRMGYKSEQHVNGKLYFAMKWFHLDCFNERTTFCKTSGKENLKIEDLEILYNKLEGYKMSDSKKKKWIEKLEKNEVKKEAKEARDNAYMDEGIPAIINNSLTGKLWECTVAGIKELLKDHGNNVAKLKKGKLINMVVELGIENELIRNIAKDGLKKDYTLSGLTDILVKYKIQPKAKANKDELVNQILEAKSLDDGEMASVVIVDEKDREPFLPITELNGLVLMS